MHERLFKNQSESAVDSHGLDLIRLAKLEFLRFLGRILEETQEVFLARGSHPTPPPWQKAVTNNTGNIHFTWHKKDYMAARNMSVCLQHIFQDQLRGFRHTVLKDNAATLPESQSSQLHVGGRVPSLE